LGSSFDDQEIIKILQTYKNKIKFVKQKDIFSKTASLISEGKIIGWFQGSAEFGPRALGNRSILCKPFPVQMRDYINKKVKFREEFRPFAPAVLEENQKDYFEINQESPYMLIACKIKKGVKKKLEATVHVDDSCRVQTVNKKYNKRFYSLIKKFNEKTDIPVLLNTSFNIKGQPIVNSPDDAVECFLKYKIDYLVINDFIIEKN
jgi:carbamoyltransferase